ncbi:histidine phosphatase family protein [Leptospira sp. 96542]|nr:histidine phosphatase family protein [Leptospira sp. 96542]
MKQIYILRHAKSDWDSPYDSDMERGLSHRGKTQTKALRNYLKESGFEFDLALVSPAERTKRTYANLRKEVLRLPKPDFRDSLYESEKEDLLFLLHGLSPSVRSVCIVGHNPGLEDLANGLLFGENLGNRFQKFPTASFLGLSFSEDSWKDIDWGTCKLSVFWIPGSIGKE